MDNLVNVYGSVTLTLTPESLRTALAPLVQELVDRLNAVARQQAMLSQNVSNLESKVEAMRSQAEGDGTDLEDKVNELESKVDDMDFDDLTSRVDDLEDKVRTVEDLPSEDEIVTTDNIGDIISDLDIGGDVKMTVEDLRHQVEGLMSLRQKLIDVLVPAVSEPVVSEPVVSEPEPAPVSEPAPVF